MKRVWFSSLLCFVAVVLIDLVMTQDLGSLVPEMGGTLCMYLAMRSQISRKFFNTCGLPTCHWDSWNDALNFDSKKAKRERIVLSFAHNGFGNQLWEHSVAFMVAESLKARLLIAIIPDSLSPNGYLPPNTWTGFNAMERLLPSEFVYENLPSDSPVRTICDKEEFYVSDRPIDWRNQNYSRNFKSQMYDLLNDEKPRCLRMVGYFQNLPLCADDARRLWTPKLFSNFTSRPGDNDISIYLRCLPRHYHFNDRHFYEAILNHTTHDRVWLFQAPECPTKLSSNPAKDGIVASVVRLLTERFNATRWVIHLSLSVIHISLLF